MKLFMKLLFAVLVLAMLLPFTILKDDHGRPLLSFSDLRLPNMASIVSKAPSPPVSAGFPTDSDDVVIYQWRDSSGQLQFSNQPPPQGTRFEARRFDPATNVIKSLEAPGDAGREPVESDEIENRENGDKPLEPGNLYSQDGIQQLLDKAQNVEKRLKQRFESQESSINQ